MKQGQDIESRFPGILIIHQKIRGNAVGLRQHDDHELFLPLQGEIQIQARGTVHQAGPGHMIYLPPDIEHSFQAGSSADGERLILIVDKKKWKRSGGGTFAPSTARVSQLCKELLFHLLIYPKTKTAKPLTETLIQTASEMIENSDLFSMSKVAHIGGQASDTRIKNAVSLVQKRFNSSLSMAELAKGAGLSTRNLNRLFLEEIGMTPKQLITLHRMEYAKKLLGQKQASVTEIAFEVGYSSVSQFIATFRKSTGQVPSSFGPF